MKVLRLALYLSCGLVLLSSCATPGPIYDDFGTSRKAVNVKVIHTGAEGEGKGRKCLASMPTPGPKDPKGNGQACKGIGAADGVACGRVGDKIKWVGAEKDEEKEGDEKVTLTSISFVDSKASDICVEPKLLVAPALECKLKAPPEGPGYAVVYKYRVDYTVSSEKEPCSVDPYIIVTRH